MIKLNKSEYSKKRREDLKKFIEETKKENVCIRCKGNDWRTLEFHHRNPKDKKFSIFQAIHNRYSIKSVIKEMEKCDIVCANCHRVIHWEWQNEGKENEDDGCY